MIFVFALIGSIINVFLYVYSKNYIKHFRSFLAQFLSDIYYQAALHFSY